MSTQLIIDVTAQRKNNVSVDSSVTFAEYVKDTDLSLTYAANRRLREILANDASDYYVLDLWLTVTERNDATGNEIVLSRRRI